MVEEPSVESMMLNKDAKTFDPIENAEILSLLPLLDDLDVVELAAGIGRFTGTIADQAKSVLAVDFIQGFCDENQRTHASKTNVKVQCQDVKEMELPDGCSTR